MLHLLDAIMTFYSCPPAPRPGLPPPCHTHLASSPGSKLSRQTAQAWLCGRLAMSSAPRRRRPGSASISAGARPVTGAWPAAGWVGVVMGQAGGETVGAMEASNQEGAQRKQLAAASSARCRPTP